MSYDIPYTWILKIVQMHLFTKLKQSYRLGKQVYGSQGIRWGGINWKIGINTYILLNRASLMAQLVKNPPAMMETWVRSLGWEDPLEKEKATHPFQYSGLENSMDYTVHGVARVRHN